MWRCCDLRGMYRCIYVSLRMLGLLKIVTSWEIISDWGFTRWLGLSDPFVEHVYGEIALKHGIPSLKTSREFNDTIFLCKLTNGLVDCPALMRDLMYGVSVRKTRQNDSFVIGNHLPLYVVNCVCKFTNDRGVDVFEVHLMETRAILIGFKWGTVLRRQVTVTAACFVFEYYVCA